MEPDSVYQSRQDGLIITALVMTVLAGTFVVLRSVSRFIIIRNSEADDYLALSSMILTICYTIMLFILRENHIGFPMSKLAPDNMVGFIKTTLAIQILYYVNVFCIKTSILITYLRFAVTRTFRMLCQGTIMLHALFFFICFVVTLAQCRPLKKMWDFTETVQGSCVNRTAFFYSTSGFNIITDFWILGLPFKTLCSIQRPRKEKIALFLTFGAGAFACVASIVRLHSIRIYTESDDPFRDGIPVNLWSMIELTVAIACASVPALKPIFSQHQRAATRAARSKSSNTYSSTATTGSMMHYTPQGSRFHFDPERTFSPSGGHVRLDSDASEARDEIHAALGFQGQKRPPLADRDNTESSGMSLGLPLQTPPPRSVPPPLMPRNFSYKNTGSYQGQGQQLAQGLTVLPPSYQHPLQHQPQQQRPAPSRTPSQASLQCPTPSRTHSQGSLHTRPAPSRTPSQGSINNRPGTGLAERPAIPRRTSSNSQRSVRIEIIPRPAGPSRNPSQGSLERPGMASRSGSQRSLDRPLVSALKSPTGGQGANGHAHGMGGGYSAYGGHGVNGQGVYGQGAVKKESQGSFYLE